MFNPSMVGLEYLCKFIFSIFLKFWLIFFNFLLISIFDPFFSIFY
jgi:hypothetical protein